MRSRIAWLVPALLVLLVSSLAPSSGGEIDVRKGGSLWARVEADGRLRIDGSLKGEVERDGDVRKDGSIVGSISPDGDVRAGGSLVGRLEKDGAVRRDGALIGEIEDGGTIRRHGSIWGSAEPCCGDFDAKRRVLALLVFFDDAYFAAEKKPR